MAFASILFDVPLESAAEPPPVTADCFSDLHLGQIFESMTAGRAEYDLRSFFYRPLARVESVTYRQEIFRDLEQPQLSASISSFAAKMRTMREYLALSEQLHHPRQKQRWFLDAVRVYCEAVAALCADLAKATLRARGWKAFHAYLRGYAASEGFTARELATRTLLEQLSSISYALLLEGRRIEVRPFRAEPDYSEEIERVFEKFRHGAAGSYRFSFPDLPNMNHIEEAILDRVALLFPDAFVALEHYHHQQQNFIDVRLRTFDREVQFYLACLEHLQQFRAVGLSFCYPTMSNQSKHVQAREAFDLALAEILLNEKKTIVTNDFYLAAGERIFVVSGANQGGKTTFARTFGQMHYLASVGCLVPGSEAQLFLYDRLFVHFEREESVATLRGKLEEELHRMHSILERVTSDSIIIMNESFSSTTLSDALFINRAILRQIIERGALCVAVTFLEELASLSEAAVSLVSTVDPMNSERRTFKLVRQPPNGRAYALAIAARYGLTYERIKERVVK